EGCAVVDQHGRMLGTVARLIALPSCEVLEVPRAAHAQPLLVPMVKDAIAHVDIAARRIVIDATFLDLDADGGPSDGA
ncbi:MAG: rRNA processing protein RimM, partial [Solirubrobacterales bacterium]|nr:rRNA processing protein RimM [Solirubrobacterales bacterium]